MTQPTIEQLEVKVAELTTLVDRLLRRTSVAEPTTLQANLERCDESVQSRRSLLRFASLAAAGLVAGSVGGEVQPASAATAPASAVGLADVAGFYRATDVEAAFAELPSLYRSSYNVRWFGAKGDGATDDTAAIQAAVVAATDGGTVFFPITAHHLPYLVSTLYMRDGVRLEGETTQVTIKKKAGSAGPVICNNAADGSGGWVSSFVSLIIDGNRTNCRSGTDGIGAHPSAGVGVGYCADALLIRDVTLQNCRRHGGFFGKHTTGMMLPVFENVRSTYNEGWGLKLSTFSDGWWNTGWVAENGLGAVNLMSSCSFRISHVQIEGNDDGSVQNNVAGYLNAVRPGLQIDSCGNIDVGPGCTFSSTRGALALNSLCNELNIHDNWFNGNNSHKTNGTYSNIRLNALTSGLRNIYIHHNRFSEFDGPDNCDRVAGASRLKRHFEVIPAPGGSYQNIVFSENSVSISPTNPNGGADALLTNNVAVETDRNHGNGAPAPTILKIPSGSTATATAFTFSAAAYDPSSQHSASSNPTRITVTADGWYRISTTGCWAEDAAGTYRIVDVFLNSKRISRSMSQKDLGGRATWSLSVPTYLTKGDFIEFIAQHDKGSALGFAQATFAVEPI